MATGATWLCFQGNKPTLHESGTVCRTNLCQYESMKKSCNQLPINGHPLKKDSSIRWTTARHFSIILLYLNSLKAARFSKTENCSGPEDIHLRENLLYTLVEKEKHKSCPTDNLLLLKGTKEKIR